MSEPPRVTLALPLFKSQRFLDVVTNNLETLAYPNLEILISDRHCADNALDILQERYTHDSRFRFVRATDELDWIAHYNSLLRAGTGEFFMWMPHDDSYPTDYIKSLVNILERTSDALAAYGDVKGLYPDGSSRWFHARCHFPANVPWTWRNAMALFLSGDLWLIMRGLFRRDALLRNRLFLAPTLNQNAADMVWLYAVTCTGRVVWTPETWCQKRFYESSTHAGWEQRTVKHTGAEISALGGLLIENQIRFGKRWRGRFLVALWAILRFGRNVLDTFALGPGLEQSIRRILLEFSSHTRA